MSASVHALRRTLTLPAVLLAVLLAGLVAAAPSHAGTANGGLAKAAGVLGSNPLTGMTWPGYHSDTVDPENDPPSAYYNLTHDPRLLPYFQTPRFRWFGDWVPMHDTYRHGRLRWGIYRTITNYIDTVRQGNRDAGVQIGIFRLTPFEHQVTGRVMSRRERAQYRAWIRQVARAIRNRHARVAMVLQPDLPLAIHQPDGGKVELGMVKWAAGVFQRLNHTSVYLDAGSADWERVGKASSILRRAGVARTRGFALGLTHYDSTPRQINYGRKLVRDLARHGIKDKHFVVSTAMNGHGFTFQQHRNVFHHGNICPSRSAHACVTLGQPFTTQTAAPSVVDAYLWAGRGWYNNATIRTHSELVQLLDTSPFF